MSAASLPLLTASRLRDARSCQRLHRFKYGLGYRVSADADTLRFGRLLHAALEAWWLAPAADRAAASEAALAGAGETDPFDLARARALMLGYDARWSSEQFEVLGVEVEFRAPLRNPETGAVSRTWDLGGKIDAIVRDHHGRTMLVEHKTTSEDVRPGSSYWARLRLDGQISIYYEGARSLGHDVEGCIFDVLSKPTLRPGKANQRRKVDETPDEFFERCVQAIAEDPAGYFARGEVVRLEAEMSEAMIDVWQIGKMLRENEIAGRFPRNVDSCFKWGRPCDFWSVCAGEASLEDSHRYRRSETVHPELEGANGAA